MAKKNYVVVLQRGVLFEVKVAAENMDEARQLGLEKAETIELQSIPWASMFEQDDDKVIEVEEKK